MDTPLDFLAQAEAELAAADYDESATGVDRRQFMFFSLVAAAASTFGAQAAGASSVAPRMRRPEAPPAFEAAAPTAASRVLLEEARAELHSLVASYRDTQRYTKRFEVRLIKDTME